MPFTVNRVSLKELAKSLEFVSRDQLKVEIVEKGESTDANIWYVKRDDRLSPTVRTKALAAPFNTPFWCQRSYSIRMLA
jgi:hypothetical protein